MKKLILSLLAFAAFTGIQIKASGIIYNLGSKDIDVFQFIPATEGQHDNKIGTLYSLPGKKSIHVPASGQYKINFGSGYMINFDTKTISMAHAPKSIVFNITDDIYVSPTSNSDNPFMNSTQGQAVLAADAAYAADLANRTKLTVSNINQNSMNCLYIAPAGSTTFTIIIPGQSFTATNPGTYFICINSNGTGPALSFTYANSAAHTPITISSCYLQNGQIASGSSSTALPSVTNTGRINISSESGWAVKAGASIPTPVIATPKFPLAQTTFGVTLNNSQPTDVYLGCSYPQANNRTYNSGVISGKSTMGLAASYYITLTNNNANDLTSNFAYITYLGSNTYQVDNYAQGSRVSSYQVTAQSTSSSLPNLYILPDSTVACGLKLSGTQS